MSERKPLLIELGVEEIPHWMIVPALEEYKRLFGELLGQNRLEAGAIRADATPRRLVLRTELDERQADREEVVMGPPKSAGAGAAQGFARKNNAAVEELAIEATPKGEYYALHKKVEGRRTREILAESMPALIAKIPWPKTMYWTGKEGLRFIRPIRWIAALLGDSIIEFEVAGVKAGALTCGHRRMGAEEIVFDHSDYEERLEKNGVILSAEKREKRIRDGVKKLIRGKGIKLIPDEALLDDIVYLTEFPTPILGDFNPAFLELPREVLSTVMRHHQRYFTLMDGDGKMAPHFIAVMNMKADRKGCVKKGNERVLEARFNDARFFWEFDQRKKLAERVPDLEHVTFQTRLGSYKEKRLGMEAGAMRLAEPLRLNKALVERAVGLCKTDLMTEMVKELTELQGVIGGLYARVQGEPEEVWRAIYEHYLPQSIEDSIPSTAEGRVVALADKLDTLEGCFALDMIPSGSRDPLALRRAALGVVRILVEGRLKLNFREIVSAGSEETDRTFRRSMPGYSSIREADGSLRLTRQLLEFLLERARYYFRDVKGFAYDEVNAALAGKWETLVDLSDRLYALKLVRQTENFEPLAASFKRIRNILRQAEWKEGGIDATLLAEGEERRLFEETSRVLEAVARYRQATDYIQALGAIATLRPAVDAFFDRILVNAPDEGIRRNRLALLGRLFNEVSSIADFSEIVTASMSE